MSHQAEAGLNQEAEPENTVNDAKNDAAEQFALGDRYYTGDGVPQDYVQARCCYKKAAAQGYAGAQYSLGLIYEEGHGVRPDYRRARKWYAKVAAQGYAKAQFALGQFFCDGLGGSRTTGRRISGLRKQQRRGRLMPCITWALCTMRGWGCVVIIKRCGSCMSRLQPGENPKHSATWESCMLSAEAVSRILSRRGIGWKRLRLRDISRPGWSWRK